MPNDSFSWLHLTDFHYGLKSQGHLWPTLRQPFLDSLEALHEKCGPWNAVLLTGDLVQSGKSDEFKKMQAEVLEPLWQKLTELGSGDAMLLAVPGNHDLYRPNPADDDPAAERLLESGGFERIEEKFWDQPAGSYRRVANNAFAAYSEWWKAAPRRANSIRDGILPGDFSTTLSCGSRRIGIVGLNTTFLQLAGGDYKERLVWDARQVHAVCDGGVDVWSKQHDVCLLLTHQGPDWLTPEARKYGESEIAPAGRFAVQLFGHQHELEMKYIRTGGSTNSIRLCQGCSVFGMDKYGEPPKTQRSHGYSAGRIEFGDGQTVLRIWPRIATNKTGPWRFVPDHEHAELLDDEGTAPDPIAARPRPVQVALPTPNASIGVAASNALDDISSRSEFRYDALISYRRAEPDKAFARSLLRKLETQGFKVAIDERDFDPAASFLNEMERCIKESRFTLAVTSPRYLASGNCVEEAIICKVLDMNQQKRRLIPLVIEPVELPTWLYLIVGINFTDTDPLIDPETRLIAKLKESSTDSKFEWDAAATTTSALHSTLPLRRWFFGRKLDLEKIAKYLSPEDRSWGVLLDGPGGVGKTALALEAAYRAPAEHFPLKLWITAQNRELRPDGEQELTDHRVDDYYELLNELGRALGRDDIPRAIPEERPGLIRHALANHRALLVLDNLETFRPEEQRRLFELLGSLPSGCRAIVTSRRRIDSAAHGIRLDKLEREAADELLAELGQRWEPVAQLTAAERDQLYAETGGNPLLLTWTAGQLGRTTGRCRTVAEAVERLQEAHRLQSLGEQNDPLDFVFGDLVETFTPDETAMLAALVHFTQPAKLEWLLPMTELSPMAAETALDGLRDRSLLVENDVLGTWLLPSLAARFLRRARPEAVGASGERLADWAYALAVENGYQQHSRFSTLEAAWPQLAAALPVLIAKDNRRLQTMCNALHYFLDFTGRWDDLLSLNSVAELKAVSAKDFSNAGKRAYTVGWCHYLRGQSAEVLACADRVTTHGSVASAGASERANAIRLRGIGHQLAKNYPAAVTAFRESLVLVRTLTPRNRSEPDILNDVAEGLHASGQFDEAETNYREGLAIATALPYPEGVAYITGNLSELALDREQWPEAERLARQALKLAEEVGRKELIASDCQRLAQALAGQSRGGEGRGHAERAVAIFTELRSPDLADAQVVLAECQR